MDYRTLKNPLRVFCNVFLRVGSLIFLVYFIILDYKVDFDNTIILERQFLKTRRILIGIEIWQLKFWLNHKQLTFNAFQSMKQPKDMYLISILYIDDYDALVFAIQERLRVKTLVTVLLNFEYADIDKYDEMVRALNILGFYKFAPQKLDLYLKNGVTLPTKPSNEKPPIGISNTFYPISAMLWGANNTLSFIIEVELVE